MKVNLLLPSKNLGNRTLLTVRANLSCTPPKREEGRGEVRKFHSTFTSFNRALPRSSRRALDASRTNFDTFSPFLRKVCYELYL